MSHVTRVRHVRTGTKIASRLIVFWQASVPRRSPSLDDVTILGETCSSYFPAGYNTDSSTEAREFRRTNVPPRWQPTSRGAPRVMFRTFSHSLSLSLSLSASDFAIVRTGSKCEEFHIGSARRDARCTISSLRAICRNDTAKYSSDKYNNLFPWRFTATELLKRWCIDTS